MPTERMEEVEVVLSRDAIIEAMYESDNNPAWPSPCPTRLPVLEGSLTSARLRLADAAEAYAVLMDTGFSGANVPEFEVIAATEKLIDAKDEVAALRTARGEG